jgi:hypothetical protein
VIARGLAGGIDTAQLTGSAESDILKANSVLSQLYSGHYSTMAVGFEQVSVNGLAGSDVAKLYDAVLESGHTNDPVPAGVDSIVWLEQFEQIKQLNPPENGGVSVTEAIDEVFTAYWE